MSDTVPVAVVVVTWNCRAHAIACLESVDRLDPRPSEVVVVDNASHDDTVATLADRFPFARVIANDTNAGYCRANNQGIAVTRSPFVLLLNPDARLAPDFLNVLLPEFDDRDVGIACGKLLRFDGSTIDSAGLMLGRSRQPIDRGYGRNDTGQFDRPDDVFGACGAAALYRRAMLDAVALSAGEIFDERYFAYYEDLDLSWRAQRRGWKAVYRPTVVGRHARGGTSTAAPWIRRIAAMLGRDRKVRFHIVKNRYLTILRNDTWGSYVANLPFIAARDVATALILLLTSPGVFADLWNHRGVFRDTWRRRRTERVGQAA